MSCTYSRNLRRGCGGLKLRKLARISNSRLPAGRCPGDRITPGTFIHQVSRGPSSPRQTGLRSVSCHLHGPGIHAAESCARGQRGTFITGPREPPSGPRVCMFPTASYGRCQERWPWAQRAWTAVTHVHPSPEATGRGHVCSSRWCTHTGAGLGLSVTDAVLFLSRLSNITAFRTTQDDMLLGPHVRTNQREVRIIHISKASVLTPAGTRREDPAPQPPSAHRRT